MEENKTDTNIEEKVTEINIEEKTPEIEPHQPQNTQKESKSKNNFIKKYIIFIIVMILITTLGIFFTIKYIDQNSNNSEISEYENNEDINEEKKVAEDSKYTVKSYSETYDTNSINIINYYDLDGNLTTEYKYADYNSRIEFIQINGLKDINIQNQINNRLKEEAYNLKKDFVYTDVYGNFSNILSLQISGHNTNETSYEHIVINIDLTTGKDIPFEKIFVSSAPIKSMIASGMYENFAWNKLYGENGEYTEYIDMNDVDTSEIEDEILLAVSKYDKIKDKIEYTISPRGVNIYNEEIEATIDFVKYMNEVAIYKRYLTEESIFENNNIGEKGVIVFTNDKSIFDGLGTSVSYGKISDNIFVEEFLWNWENLDEQEINTVIGYVESLSKEQKTILQQETPENKGVIFQREYMPYKEENGSYYRIDVYSYKAECTISYFKEDAFKHYIEVNGADRADVGINSFQPYMKEEYPEMQIFESEYKSYYISFTGEFLGNTEEEVQRKIWE